MNILGEPVKEADGWSKLSNPAGEYFDLIAASIEDRLIRSRTWAFDDITIQDPEFGDSSPSNLMEYLINIVKAIMSAIEEVRKEMDILGSLASEGAVEQTGNEIEIADFLSDQESDEEKKMERFDYCLERRQHLVGLAVELAREFQTTSPLRIHTESKKIAFAVWRLVRLTDAVHMHQASEYLSGPLAGRQQEILKIRHKIEAKTNLQQRLTETNQGEPARDVSSRTSTSSRYSQDDGYGTPSDTQIMDE